MILVDACFRAISFFQESIVEMYGDGLGDHIKREMKGHRQIISAREHVVELASESSFGESKS